MEMMLFVQTQISKSFHTFSFLWTEALPKGKLQHFVTCCDLAVLYWLLSYCSCLKWVSLGKLRLQMELCYFRPSLCWTSQWIWNKWNKRNSAGPKDFSLTAILQVSWQQFLHFLSCPCIIFLVKQARSKVNILIPDLFIVLWCSYLAYLPLVMLICKPRQEHHPCAHPIAGSQLMCRSGDGMGTVGGLSLSPFPSSAPGCDHS